MESKKVETIFLAPFYTKLNKKSLSSLDETIRRETVNKMKVYVERCYYYGSKAMLINSGPRPAEDQMQEAVTRFEESIREILAYAEKKAESYTLDILLEPGDIGVEYDEVYGHTANVISHVERIREEFGHYYLTMDISHIRQLGEDIEEALSLAKPYCYHIHMANCYLKDPQNEWYGDKHLEFGARESELDMLDAIRITERIQKMYQGDSLILGLEMIERGQGLWERVTETMGWFVNRSL